MKEVLLLPFNRNRLRKLYFIILFLVSVLVCHAQIGRFVGGFGFLVLNDYINQKQVKAIDLNYASALSINAALGANVVYLSNDQSLSLTVDPLFSVVNLKSDVINRHMALPIMAKYNWGIVSNIATDRVIGFSFGAGLSKHWFFAQETYASKLQPTISAAFRFRVALKKFNLFKAEGQSHFVTVYNNCELVLYHGFEQDIIEVETLTPDSFTWTAFCLRFYLTKNSYSHPVQVGF